jgi:glycosyltransferase involved in cell wall biosynthesis
MQIKLLINVAPIRKPLTGIGYYTLNILSELLTRDIEVLGLQNGRLLSRDQLTSLTQIFLSSNEHSVSNSNHLKRRLVEFLRSVPGVYQAKNILLSYRVKRVLAQLAQDGYVYFEPSFVPFAYKGKIITTVHDLSFISYPEFHPQTRVTYLTSKIVEAIQNSTHVIVDSYYILKEMHGYFPFSVSKSSTVYLGVDTQFRHYSEAECATINHCFGFNYKKFILSVATLEPRKNLRRLIAAYKLLPEQVRNEYPLVLVGDQGWKNSELFVDAEELIEQNQIIFTGYVSDNYLKQLYASAMIFAYPSLYEGFGLPVVEAMASGAPVITSSRGATAEISGQCAVLVDPENEQSIASAIIDLINQPEQREAISARGIEYVQKYRWTHTVDEILEVAVTTSNYE